MDNLYSHEHENNNSSPSPLSIQEVEVQPQPQPQPQPVVRMVPIKLLDGKVIQKEPEESMQIKAEFTNFTHQEFSDDKRKLHASPIHDRSLKTKNLGY